MSVVTAALIVLSLVTICMGLRLNRKRKRISSMEQCIAQAWPIRGSRLRRVVARHHNAGLVLELARTMRGAEWYYEWDPDMRQTLIQMESSAVAVRRETLGSILGSANSAYERMVEAETHVCMRLRPELLDRIEDSF